MLREVVQYIEPYDPGLFPEDLAEKTGKPLSKIINLGSNENPYPPSPAVLKAICRESNSVNRYPHPSYNILKEKLSRYVSVDINKISVGAGASELLDSVCKIYLDPFDKVIVPIPTYTLYILLAMLREADVRFMETEEENFHLDWDALTLKAKGAKLTFIGSPNNPTGIAVSIEDLSGVLERIDGTIVLDETYQEFSGISAGELIEEFDNLIIIRSMSKYFSMAGLRMGYAISSRGITKAIEKIRLPFSVSRLAVKASIKVFQEISFFTTVRKKIISQRDLMFKELSQFRFIEAYPSQANFILMRVLKNPFKKSLAEYFANRGVIVRDLTGLLGLHGEYLRVTVGRGEENKVFLELCREIESS